MLIQRTIYFTFFCNIRIREIFLTSNKNAYYHFFFTVHSCSILTAFKRQQPRLVENLLQHIIVDKLCKSLNLKKKTKKREKTNNMFHWHFASLRLSATHITIFISVCSIYTRK